MTLSAGAEIDWVLRTAREFAPDPAHRKQATIARGVDDLPPVDRAQISRWEAGRGPLKYTRIRRYERILGLPAHQLLCLIEQIHRDRNPVRYLPIVEIPPPDDLAGRVEDLLDRALADEPMRGVEWDELTSLCASNPGIIVRSSDRLALLQRCLGELDLSVGLEYALRLESLARMASNPRTASLIVGYVADILADPDRTFYAEAAALLQYSPDPAAGHLLVGAIQHPVNEGTWRWSASTLASKVQHGHPMDPHSRAVALRESFAALADQSLGLPTQAAAAALAHSLGEGQRVARTLGDRAGLADRRTLLTGRVLGDEQRARIERRVHQGIEADFDPHLPDTRVLNRLLLDLSGVESKERGHALAILVLSPFGPYVGDAYLQELGTAIAASEPAVAHDALAVLRSLVQPDHAPVLVSYLEWPGLPPTLVESLGIDIGNRPEQDTHPNIDEAVCAAAIRLAQQRSDRCIARGLTYALGMRRQKSLLRRLLEGCADPTWRSYAQWWIEQT